MRELDDITGASVQAKQLLTDLKLTNMPVGLFISFGAATLL
jgi:hypothetical protein